MSYDLPPELVVEHDGPIRIVTLNRPADLNAVNEGLHRGLAMVWSQLAADPDARAVVVTGAGRAFSAGGDFEWFGSLQEDMEVRRRVMREARVIVLEMIRCHLPVVAVVNGPAVGLGCSLAVLADVVFMSENAFLADPHVAVGLVAGDGGAVSWPLLTSLLRAKEYIFTGDRIPAQEAERLGLANRVVAADEVFDAGMAFARRLADLPPQALQDTKRALNMHLERAADGILDFALAAESECFTSVDHKQRISAALGDGG